MQQQAVPPPDSQTWWLKCHLNSWSSHRKSLKSELNRLCLQLYLCWQSTFFTIAVFPSLVFQDNKDYTVTLPFLALMTFKAIGEVLQTSVFRGLLHSCNQKRERWWMPLPPPTQRKTSILWITCLALEIQTEKGGKIVSKVHSKRKTGQINT